MRDDRQPFRLADLSLAAPLLPSLFMAVYGVMSQPSQLALPVLLGIHAFCMAWAAASASGRAASRVGFWVQRRAPDAALARERGQWRRTLLWTLGCGLLGPVVLAVRLSEAPQGLPALWVIAFTLLGAAAGAWAGFAWFGMATRRALLVWPVLAGLGILLPVAWPRLQEHPALSAALAVLMLAGGLYVALLALRSARQTVPVWAGMRQKPGVLPDPATRTSPKARWDALAFDSGREGPERSLVQIFLNQSLTFSLVGPIAVGFAMTTTGWRVVGTFVWQLLLFDYVAGGLLLKDQHRRMRLAPQGISQHRRVWQMLAGSVVFWLFNASLMVLMTAWMLPPPGELWAVLAELAADVLLAVACAAWLRSVSNRGVTVGMGALAYACVHAGVAWLEVAQGFATDPAPLHALAQAALGLVVLDAARRRWMQRSLYGRSFRPFA